MKNSRYAASNPLLVASLFVFLVLAGCDSNARLTEEDMTLQARNAVDVLPVEPAVVAMFNPEDLTGQNNPTLMNLMQDRIQSGDMTQLRNFVEATGFDPMKDITEMYVAIEEPAGNAEPGVSVAAYASIEPDRLEAYVEEQIGDDVVRRTYRGIDLYESDDPQQKPAFSFVNDDMILAASRVELLEAMIDRLIDNAEALSANDGLMELVARASVGKSGWFVAEKPAGSPDLNEGAGNFEDSFSQIWSAVDRMAIALNVESNGMESQAFLYPEANVSTKDLESLTKGFRSAMKSAPEIDQKGLALLDKVKVNASDEYVRVQLFADNAFIEEMSE